MDNFGAFLTNTKQRGKIVNHSPLTIQYRLYFTTTVNVKETIYQSINQSINQLERFSIQCRKTETKVITSTNHKNVNNTMDQSKLKANTCNRRQARENACERGTIVVKQNQSKREITFDTQLTTALINQSINQSINQTNKQTYIPPEPVTCSLPPLCPLPVKQTCHSNQQ